MADEQTIGILVGAAPLGSEEEILKKITTDRKCKVTAVDGGLSFFVRNMAIEGTLGPDGYKAEGGCSTMAGLRPDYWIGDADSLAEGGVDISLVKEIASIDLKKNEKALSDFAAELGLPFVTFTPEELIR